ncbi:MAG: EAL domain-containing protein [Gammaproteobacteria bacterium]|nr:EAL domain-containing protein [Gammaproteobacteria bacterium]
MLHESHDIDIAARPDPKRLWLSLESLVFLLALLTFYAFTRWSHPASTALLTDLAWTLASLAVGIRCLVTSQKLNIVQARPWLYFAAASLMWFAGMVLWDYNELGREIAVPFPSLSDLGFQGFAVLFLAGIISLLPRRSSLFMNMKQLGMMGALCCCLILAHIIAFTPLVRSDTLSLAYTLAALAYPVVYISVLLYAISIHWQVIARQRIFTLLICGFAVHAFTNSVYAYGLLGHTYNVGNQIDILWLVGFFLIYEAARQTAVFSDARLVADQPAGTKMDLIGLSYLESAITPLALSGVALITFQFRNSLTEQTLLWSLPFGLMLSAFIALREYSNLHEAAAYNIKLLDNQRRLQTLVNTIPYGIQETDLSGYITYANQSLHHILGAVPGQLEGMHIRSLFIDGDDAKRAALDIRLLIKARPEPRPYYFKIKRLDNNKPITIKLDWNYKYSSDNSLCGFIFVISDVTEQQNAQDQLKQAAAVFENTDEGVIITSADNRIISVNRAFCTITGYSSGDAVGKATHFLLSDRHEPHAINDLLQQVQAHDHWQGELWYRRRGGATFPVWQTVSVIRSGGAITHHVHVFTDISPIKESQEKLDFLAHHDPLTQLPNRLLMMDRLSQGLQRARRDGTMVALLMIDMDRFKDINDSLGHGVGDTMLQQSSLRLKNCLRNQDTVARLGGDEFVAILDDIVDIDDISRIAAKVVEAFKEPFTIDHHVLHSSVSVGISLFPKDGQDEHILIKNADAAMYRSKSHGRNNFSFYSEDMTVAAQKRLTTENDLRHALNSDQLISWYQPLIDVSTGHTIGFESLLRWNHPTRGLLAPGDFLEIAEDTRLIIPIGKIMLNTACHQFQHWRERGYLVQRIAVNLSGAQLQQDDITATVAEALSRSGLPAECLELEISENFVVRGGDQAINRLQSLSKLGISLSIDDFGTGYSSLNYLKRLPVNRLKIDRSFVRDLPNDPQDRIISRAIIGLAHNLELDITAEGIETPEQLAYLKSLGCHEAQGYLFSPALHPELVTNYLDHHQNGAKFFLNM